MWLAELLESISRTQPRRMANVLLESMACGTLVVATNVRGTPGVVPLPEAGVLMGELTAGWLQAMQKLLSRTPNWQQPDSMRRCLA
jgi:glycosyltransferase involved in cell wall biosynthesis